MVNKRAESDALHDTAQGESTTTDSGV